MMSLVAALLLAACGGVTSPYGGGGGNGGGGGMGGGGGGGGGGSGGGAADQVTIGNDFFRNAQDGSENPAVNTVAAGSTVTWTWSVAAAHSVQSTGTGGTIFRSSSIMSTLNGTYTVTFNTPGRYPYQCAVHGAAMTGVIVVQ
jgi:plastocyanin